MDWLASRNCNEQLRWMCKCSICVAVAHTAHLKQYECTFYDYLSPSPVLLRRNFPYGSQNVSFKPQIYIYIYTEYLPEYLLEELHQQLPCWTRHFSMSNGEFPSTATVHWSSRGLLNGTLAVGMKYIFKCWFVLPDAFDLISSHILWKNIPTKSWLHFSPRSNKICRELNHDPDYPCVFNLASNYTNIFTLAPSAKVLFQARCVELHSAGVGVFMHTAAMTTGNHLTAA